MSESHHSPILPHSFPDNGLKGTVVNRTCLFYWKVNLNCAYSPFNRLVNHIFLTANYQETMKDCKRLVNDTKPECFIKFLSSYIQDFSSFKQFRLRDCKRIYRCPHICKLECTIHDGTLGMIRNEDL